MLIRMLLRKVLKKSEIVGLAQKTLKGVKLLLKLETVKQQVLLLQLQIVNVRMLKELDALLEMPLELFQILALILKT